MPAATILIVEDEPLILQFVEEMLRSAGYDTLAAAGWDAAVAALEGGTAIDLLFTDVWLDRNSGFELAERARAMHPGVHVIYATGYIPKDMMARHHAGAPDGVLLTKPYRPAELMAEIARMLAG